MTCSDARVSWTDLEHRLRPFVRKRVPRDADTDDVLQEILLRVHRGLGSLRDEDRLDAWIHRVARHAIADQLRAHAKHPPAITTDVPETLDDSVGADSDGDVGSGLAQCLSGFVALLPSPYREAITLTELEGRTQKEAAALLGISLTATKSRVRRGREKLREMLEECCRIELDARGRVLDFEPRCCPGD